MQRNLLLTGLGGAAMALAAGLIWLGVASRIAPEQGTSETPRPPTYDARHEEERLGALEFELMRLQAQFEGLQAEDGVTAYVPGTERAFAAERQAPEPDPPSPEEQAATAVGQFEGRLGAERLDRELTDQTRDAIERSLAELELTGTRVAGAECGETLCRVDFAFDGLDTRAHALSSLPTTIPWDASFFYEVGPQDTEVAIYVSREGEDL